MIMVVGEGTRATSNKKKLQGGNGRQKMTLTQEQARSLQFRDSTLSEIHRRGEEMNMRTYRDWKGKKKKMKLDFMSVISRKRREIQEEIKNRDTDEKK